MPVSSSASCVISPGGARDAEALYVAPATLVADALVVKSDGRGKRMGSRSKDHQFNQMESAGARRPGKCQQREVSPFVASGETDAEYLAEVAVADAMLANYKRRQDERQLHGYHVSVGPVG